MSEPGKGIHSLRFMNLAIVDIVGTIGLAVFFKWIAGSQAALWKWILSFFLLGILLHRIFNIRTTIDKLLFPHIEV
jgi:hypothetical protein